MTIAIGASAPRGCSASRSMTKKPRQVRVAAWAWPATTPATIQRRMRGSFHLSRFARRGAVAAMTLAPVGGRGERRIAHRRAAPELRRS